MIVYLTVMVIDYENSVSLSRSWTAITSVLTWTSPDVTIVEPALTMEKTSTWPNDQWVISYTITIDHDWTSSSDAFDVTVNDLFDTWVNIYQLGTFNSVSWLAPTTISESEEQLSFVYDTIPTTWQSIVSFDVELTSSTWSSQSISNTATGYRSSLPNTSTGSRSSWSVHPYSMTGTDTISFEYADLAVEMSRIAIATPALWDLVTYEIVLTHQGGTWVSSAGVINTLPTWLTFVSATPSTWLYDQSTNERTVWSLISGDSLTLTIQARISQYGSFRHSVEIASMQWTDSDSTPSNSSNNEDDDSSVHHISISTIMK